MARGPDVIPRVRLAAILEREIAARHDETGQGGVAVLAAEVAAFTGGQTASYEKRIRVILGSQERDRNGRAYVQKTVDATTADTYLTALGLQMAWHEELADLFPVPERDVTDSWCTRCEEWTLGKTCAWCDARTVTLDRMLGRSRIGECEICGRHSRGLVGGHRLCGRHTKLRVKLGKPLDRRDLAVAA